MNERIIIAAIGGFVYCFLPLVEMAQTPPESRPDFKDVFYWLPYLSWPILGGLLAFLYEIPEGAKSRLISFHIGLSAPIILRQMLQTLPIQPGKIPLKDNNQ